jgi:AcrR family transcriptional regulator
MNDAALPVSAASAPAARRERRDAAEHRCRILAAARQLFAAHSVALVSMHQIARAAGVGQGTLYRRYANKGELCKDLARDEHERFAEELLAWADATAHSLPALARLDGVLTRMLAFVEESMPLFETIASAQWREMANGDITPPSRGRGRERKVAWRDPAACDMADDLRYTSTDQDPWLQWLRDLLARLLAEAVAEGALAPLDVAFTADMMMGALNPLCLRLLYSQQSTRADAHARILAGLRRIFITGITGR